MNEFEEIIQRMDELKKQGKLEQQESPEDALLTQFANFANVELLPMFEEAAVAIRRKGYDSVVDLKLESKFEKVIRINVSDGRRIFSFGISYPLNAKPFGHKSYANGAAYPFDVPTSPQTGQCDRGTLNEVHEQLCDWVRKVAADAP